MKKFQRTLLALAAASALQVGALAQGSTAFKPDIDSSVAPCADFNSYVNNHWVAANPLPGDKTRWGSFDLLAEQSLNAQRSLAESAAQDKGGKGIERQIGAFYLSATDEAAIERAGFDPIKPELAAIAALKGSNDIVAWLRANHASGNGIGFSFSASADFKNAQQQIGFAFQGGLNLPSPEYYSKDEYKDKRAAYAAHVAKLFELTGVAPGAAAAKAANVLAFETRLAGSSLLPVELRVPENQYNKVSIAEANKVTPHFDWGAYFKALNVDVSGSFSGFSLSQPKFFATFDAMLVDTPAEQWRDYLALQTIDNAAANLSKPFQEENFAFYDKTLKGQPEIAARWKRALGSVNAGMGQALGQLYVKAYFPPEAKARAQALVDNVRAALKARIEKLDWMSAETKAKAIEKWGTFLPKIGYPDKWRDWSGLAVEPDDYFGNVRAARLFNYRYNLAKIGKATDRYEWSMTPQTVNAYYSPSTNTINFPAAILQPPFFYAKGDDALNYGAIGAVIGHEALHGFDDKGSQFDGHGNNRNWWTTEDRDRFEARAQRLIDQADGYAPLSKFPDKHANGKLTLGENIADLGGLNVSFDALQKAEAGKPDPKIDGFTREQRFFLSFATVWASSIRDEAQLVRLNTDPHAPNGFRASASPSNMPAFAQAFSCKAGDAMVRPEDRRVMIW